MYYYKDNGGYIATSTPVSRGEPISEEKYNAGISGIEIPEYPEVLPPPTPEERIAELESKLAAFETAYEKGVQEA